MKTLAGEMVRIAVLLLASVTVTPPAGAGEPRLIGYAALCPSPIVRLEGRLIAPGEVTVTLAVALATPASPEVAVSVAVPTAFPVTGTLTLVANAGIVTEAGTLATPELLELSPTARPPAGAGDETLRL